LHEYHRTLSDMPLFNSSPAPRIVEHVAYQTLLNQVKKVKDFKNDFPYKKNMILKLAECKLETETEITHPNAGICCDGIVFHRKAGNECCINKPFYKRKQICCGGKVFDRRKEFGVNFLKFLHFLEFFL